MVTKETPVIEIRHQTDDGIEYWTTEGKVETADFLVRLYESYAAEIAEFIRDHPLVELPQLKHVVQSFGMGAECMDGYFTEPSTHELICENQDICHFSEAGCYWITQVCSEALFRAADPT